MSYIYVPVDTSNLTEIIPEGDDVLYSTMCKAVYGDFKWQTHVLVSQSGFASFTRLEKYLTKKGKEKYKLRKKKEGLISVFTHWREPGQNRTKLKFQKKRIHHRISKTSWLFYTDIHSKELGRFCKALWLET